MPTCWQGGNGFPVQAMAHSWRASRDVITQGARCSGSNSAQGRAVTAEKVDMGKTACTSAYEETWLLLRL